VKTASAFEDTGAIEGGFGTVMVMSLMRFLSGEAVLTPSARLVFTIVRKVEVIICKHLRCGQRPSAGRSWLVVSHPLLERSEG
jgi:hypothetical protein